MSSFLKVTFNRSRKKYTDELHCWIEVFKKIHSSVVLMHVTQMPFLFRVSNVSGNVFVNGKERSLEKLRKMSWEEPADLANLTYKWSGMMCMHEER